MDLIVKNGLLVMDGLEMQADIAIKGGVVKAIGDLSGIESTDSIDATGKIILPGAVDLGFNMLGNGPFDSESAIGFSQATKQAIKGGITTVITTLELPVKGDLFADLKAQQDADTPRAFADFGYHVYVDNWNDAWASKAREAIAAGLPSFWLARTTVESPLPMPALLHAVTSKIPEDALVITSNFDAQAVRYRAGLYLGQKSEDRRWREVLPPASEAAGIAALRGWLDGVRCRVLLSGIASREALVALQELRLAGISISAAVQLGALHYTDSTDSESPRFWPPIGEKADQTALYQSLEEGLISAVISAHKPRTAKEIISQGSGDKLPDIGITTASHFLPLLHAEGIMKWRISLGTLSLCACADPAKLAGVYPRKGTLQIGSDADFVILDPAKATTPADEPPPGPHDYVDPLGINSWQGALHSVYLRGRCVVHDDVVSEQATGSFLNRKLALK